jgi:hypothetical protein
MNTPDDLDRALTRLKLASERAAALVSEEPAWHSGAPLEETRTPAAIATLSRTASSESAVSGASRSGGFDDQAAVIRADAAVSSGDSTNETPVIRPDLTGFTTDAANEAPRPDPTGPKGPNEAPSTSSPTLLGSVLYKLKAWWTRSHFRGG